MKYRVWRCVNFPSPATYYEASSPEDGARMINHLAKKDLRNPRIDTNAFGLEVFDETENEWCEWYDENGNDIDMLADELWDK